MIDAHIKLDLIRNLFKQWNGNKADFIQKLPQTASYREYYRISYNGNTVIGVFNEDTKENEAFLSVNELGADKFEIVVPSISIVAQPPVTVVDENAKKHKTYEVSKAYLEYLYSPIGQKIAAKNYYRPYPVYMDHSSH